MNQNCCDVRAAITETLDDCVAKKGGIVQAYVACYKFVTLVEDDCTAGAGNDAKITDIVTIDVDNANAVTPLFYSIAIKDKASGQTWNTTYDDASGGIKKGEEINFVIESKTRATRCVLDAMAGQEVVVIWQERGSNNWYMSGRLGGLRVQVISGGTGTDTFTPTNIQLVGEDIEDIHLQIFDTSATDTDILVASVVAA